VSFSAFVVTKPRTDLIPASVGSLGLGSGGEVVEEKKNLQSGEKKPFWKRKRRAQAG